MQSLTIALLEAHSKDYPILQNLACFYVYDMSRYCGFLPGWKCPETGLYKSYDFKKYFEDENHYPFIIRVDEELAGFVLVNKIAITSDVDWHMSEFFITAKFQRRGIGQTIAKQIWEKFPGNWEVSVIPQNERGLNFWRKAIKATTNDQYVENIVKVSWDITNPRIIFNFNIAT